MIDSNQSDSSSMAVSTRFVKIRASNVLGNYFCDKYLKQPHLQLRIYK